MSQGFAVAPVVDLHHRGRQATVLYIMGRLNQLILLILKSETL